MVTVIVNFPLPDGMSLEELTSRMKQSIPRFQSMPGLIRKSYIVDTKTRTGGGAYTFASRQEAEACFSEALIKAVTEAYGKPDIRYFDTLFQIDNEHKVVT